MRGRLVDMSHLIVAVVDDIFFASKIRATSQSIGKRMVLVRNLDQLMAELEQTPDLIIVDLHNRKTDPLEVAKMLKGRDAWKSVPLLGFFSHVETELQREALAAGYDKVVPRSVFSRDLVKILETTESQEKGGGE